MTTNMQQGTILDVLKKKMRQTKEEMEKYKDECEEYHKRLQVEIMRREEVRNVQFLCVVLTVRFLIYMCNNICVKNCLFSGVISSHVQVTLLSTYSE